MNVTGNGVKNELKLKFQHNTTLRKTNKHLVAH